MFGFIGWLLREMGKDEDERKEGDPKLRVEEDGDAAVPDDVGAGEVGERDPEPGADPGDRRRGRPQPRLEPDVRQQGARGHRDGAGARVQDLRDMQYGESPGR